MRSLRGAIFVIGFVLYPYVYLAARAMFQTQSAALAEAARTLGAGRWLRWRITLPLARPAIAVGLALALLETLNDIGASEYLGVQTLTLSIFTTWLNRGSLPGAAQIACFMLVIVAALIALERYGRRTSRGVFRRQPAAGAAHRRSPAAGALARLRAPASCRSASAFCVPLLYLAHQVFERGLLVGFDMALWRDTFNSIALASLATSIALLLGFAAILALALAAERRLRFVAMNIAHSAMPCPGRCWRSACCRRWSRSTTRSTRSPHRSDDRAGPGPGRARAPRWSSPM